MDKPVKLSPAELKRAAHEFGTRVLTVHCGYCLDDQGRVDRNRPIGWLVHGPQSMPYQERFWIALSVVHGSVGSSGLENKACSGILECPKCGRYMAIDPYYVDNALTELYLNYWTSQRRTTMKEVADSLIERGYIAVDFIAALQIADPKKDPDGAREFLRKHLEKVERDRAELYAESAELSKYYETLSLALKPKTAEPNSNTAEN